ncbi:MAG: PIN domain-containing protein [Patescibacteria group bacterium]
MINTVIVDTNIILRHFLDKDLKLVNLIDSGSSIYITFPIVFETVYMMEKYYKISRAEVYEKIMALLSLSEVELEDRNIIQVLNKYRAHKQLSLADCYLLTLSDNTGYDLITYDRKLEKHK